MEIEYTLERYDEEDNLVETTLYIEGSYDPGEREGRWGRYGATPGYPESVEIGDISERITVEGPSMSPFARGPVVYDLPWEGRLTPEETRSVEDALMEEARDNMIAAAEAAAEAAYEARYEYDY